MTVVIAGERSGSGKTTITLALLAALRARGQQVQSFKVGPDYIDPMFHAHVTGRPCYNLDLVLTSEGYLSQCLARQTQTASMAVVEGVMGLFDGAADPPGYGSTAQVAMALNLPVLLVLNCQSLSHSIAAMVHGYSCLQPQLHIAGLVLNRVGSDRHLEILESALANQPIPILGVFRREDAISLPDRHLGLIPTNELPELTEIVDRLTVLGQNCFRWEKLLPLLAVQPLPVEAVEPSLVATAVKIGVARDAAFSFYYAENLQMLEALGAELVEWSPLQDEVLPDVQGLYFGGGFPEVFAAQLAANQPMQVAVRNAIQGGLPTYAECGGLMYLTQAIADFAGQRFPMVGILPTEAQMGQRLTLGYRTAIAQADTPLVAQGEVVQGHEFHRSHLTVSPSTPLFQLQSQFKPMCGEGWHQPHLHASYLHLHWGSRPELPERFLRLARTRFKQ